MISVCCLVRVLLGNFVLKKGHAEKRELFHQLIRFNLKPHRTHPISVFFAYSNDTIACLRNLVPLWSICFHMDGPVKYWGSRCRLTLVFLQCAGYARVCVYVCVRLTTAAARASYCSGCQPSQKQVVHFMCFRSKYPSIKVKNIIYNFQCHFRRFFLSYDVDTFFLSLLHKPWTLFHVRLFSPSCVSNETITIIIMIIFCCHRRPNTWS